MQALSQIQPLQQWSKSFLTPEQTLKTTTLILVRVLPWLPRHCFDLNIEMCEEIKVLSQNSTSSHPPCHRRNTEWRLVYYVLLNLGMSMALHLFWPSKAFLYLIAPSLTSGAVSSLMWTSLNWECSGMEAHLWMLNHTWNCANYIYSLHRLAYLSSSMVIFLNWDEVNYVSGGQPHLHFFNSSVKFTEQRETNIDHAASTCIHTDVY